MPIISATVLDKKNYRVTVTMGNGILENIVVTDDGLYSIYYIKDGNNINATGRIVNIVQHPSICKNSYVLFDKSEDNSNKKERIYFHQIQYIKDITPNDAYRIAVEHGFVGTVEDWLESMKGLPGKDAYEIAVECGYEGTREEWVASMATGGNGLSAYEIAVNHGFEGTEEEWLASLHGRDGDGISAYEIAVNHGFEGTEEEWLESLKGKSAYEIALEYGFEGTEEEWMAANGDVTAIRQDVEEIKSTMQWDTGMGEVVEGM